MNELAPAPFSPDRSWRSLFSIGLFLTLLALLILTPFSIMAQERVIRVARVSLVEGDVNFRRAQDKRDEWFEATANLPLDENDQVYTGSNGRSEIQLTGGNLVRLSLDTNLKLAQFNNATMQFALSIGTATFRIGNLDRRKLQTVDASEADNDQPIYFEVDSPVVAITLLREGNYRINVAPDGTTELIVRRGAAEVFNKELGTIPVKEGRRIIVEGADSTLYQVRKLDDKDDWDRWNERRDEELFARAEYRSIRHVPASIPGVYDLDLHGDWYEAPGYGWVWSPRIVAAGWAPYRTGSWRWYSSYGWTWIGYEPWGWVPYHYGRWAYWSNRWCWVPQVSFGGSFGWSWSPALVAFYGSRGGYRDGFSDGYRRGYRDGAYDWIGWVPLGPGEHPRGSVAGGRGPVLIERASMLRNYTAPGGVSGVEGRDFDRARVLVRNVVAEPSRAGAGRSVEVLPVQLDQFKPKDVEAPKAVQIPRSSTGRDLNAPVVVRRSPVPTTVETSGTVQTEGSRPTRETSGRSRPVGEMPARAGEAGSGSAASTSSGGERIARPSRAVEFTPAERPLPPTRSTQSGAAAGAAGPRREQSAPAPARSEAPRRVEQPAAPPRIERPAPSRSEEPRRIERPEGTPRPSSPPPPPRPERQAQPSQERQAQPSPERSREGSAPARSAPPTKKPDAD